MADKVYYIFCKSICYYINAIFAKMIPQNIAIWNKANHFFHIFHQQQQLCFNVMM